MAGAEIIVADIGGTNARFALATIGDGGRPALRQIMRLAAADHAGLEQAWRAFAGYIGRALPDRAAIAVAAPLRGEVLRFTNSPWTIDRRRIGEALGLADLLLINDFGAAGHALDVLEPAELAYVCGPDQPLPRTGSVSVIGPGTGLGVAILGYGDGPPLVIETEGGHVAFAPIDDFEAAVAERVRRRHGRVSTERMVSGAALADIRATLAEIEGRDAPALDSAELWKSALAGEDDLLSRAVDRFCLMLGSVAGDLALAHGAGGVALGGGIGPRLLDRLRDGGFHQRFIAKGRYEGYMAAMPVRMMVHPEPGLLGAAVAYDRMRKTP